MERVGRRRVRVRVSETEGERERGSEREGVRESEREKVVKVNSPASVPAWKHRRYSEQGRVVFWKDSRRTRVCNQHLSLSSASQPHLQLSYCTSCTTAQHYSANG